MFLKKRVALLGTLLIISLNLFVLGGITRAQGQTSQSRQEVRVHILMYHAISANESLQGKYTVSPEEFEADLIYLKEHGYTTVTMTELIAFVNKGDALPENPIVLTFDDGNYSDYCYALPLLQQYEMKAVFSIMGKQADEYTAENRTDINYPNLVWPQVTEMISSGCAEIQNHGYDLHNQQVDAVDAQKRAGESDEEYKSRISRDLQRMQDSCYAETGWMPDTFTYPFGIKNSLADEVVCEMGFSASLICEEHVNTLRQGETACLYNLGRYLRPGGSSSEGFFTGLGLN